MGEQRQQYNEDFKRQAINSVQEQQKTVTDIAQKLTPYINKCSVLRIWERACRKPWACASAETASKKKER